MTTTIRPTEDTSTHKPEGTAHVPRKSDASAMVRHTLTLTWRSLVKLKKQSEQLIDLTLQPILFLVMFVYLFGGAIEGSTHDYLQFVLPGVLVQTVVFASVGTGVGLCTDMSTGVFDRFRSLPISRIAPLTGTVLGDVLRFLVAVASVFVFGTIIGFRFQTNVFAVAAAVGLVMLFAFAFCWVVALLGVTMKQPRSVQGVSFLMMFPLTFGSNLFAKTSTMPGWLQAWVKVNPITAVTNASRGLLTGGPVAHHATVAVIWAFALMVVFIPLTLRQYNRRV
ncbi:ABC transporter permease [Embleya scabrispora]|uniref:ABC transporter permease n=1 Tax=Embleya scabrispora TaxID=159449 RepID=UPI00035C3315|nr:ABC transporter permease [Embleya scabrispora]MYS84311.1 ABC transporter permease [Streptomyces sp. SID5474]